MGWEPGAGTGCLYLVRSLNVPTAACERRRRGGVIHREVTVGAGEGGDGVARSGQSKAISLVGCSLG